MDLEELLKTTVAHKASDLHLTVGAPPAFRLHGEMERLPYPDMTRDVLRAMLLSILTGEQQNKFEEKHDLDFSIEIPNVARFRANYFVGRRGESAVFRVIPTEIKTIEDLGLPPIVRELARQEKGLVLVTGATGSGKSTTLAAMVDMINRERSAHILTVEDPIEFVHPHKKCLVNQREVRVHTETFASALRAALREDPDVILVGEMRDLETISLAVSAAETGHLVFGTLHTSSAAQTVDRIIDVFPPHQQSQIRTQLAESIQGVIAQSLLPKVGGGRIAALEIMTSTAAVKNLIREGKTFQLPSVIETNTNIGMQTLGQALQELLLAGKITPAAAIAKGMPPELIATLRLPTLAAEPAHVPSFAPEPPKLTLTEAAPPVTHTPIRPLSDDDDLGDLKPLQGNGFFGR
ncbi:MAG: type IV pilus twitching motility protein PilT [Capsulimonas sp.]|uniref:type IV pilus twitching motility protein PilT n=1 Tax=Capsulimonas sp. TaxID=2494211 RepID=UPI0032658A66